MFGGAKFGRQPSGMIRLEDGSEWDPRTPLPPMSANDFNTIPMGSPVAGYGQQAPRAPMGGPMVPEQPAAPQMAAREPLGVDSAAPIARPGMFGGLPQSAMAKVKPHLFDQGGMGRPILGAIGDALSTWGGGQPIYAPLMQERRQQARQDQRDQTRAQRDRDEWIARQQYEAAHPNDPFTQYMRAANIDPASPQGRNLYRQRAESMATPPLVAVDGFDQVSGQPSKTFMPRTAFNPGGTAASTAPVSRTIGDKTYYQINGEWYDNPEGR